MYIYHSLRSSTTMAAIKARHPELFKPDLQIDRQSGIRTVPMEVMNLGFLRTGTMCESPTPNIIFLSSPRLSSSYFKINTAPPLIISCKPPSISSATDATIPSSGSPTYAIAPLGTWPRTPSSSQKGPPSPGRNGMLCSAPSALSLLIPRL